MKYKLVAFDVDGTLIDNIIYSWELFHNFFEVDPKKRMDTKESYYKGEISYIDWAKHDIGMWIEKKKSKKDFFNALNHNDAKLMAGALEVLQRLKKAGIKLAIISGSLDIIPEYFIPNYRDIFDYVFLSKLIFDKRGMLVGSEPTEYDMIKKLDALQKIARKENISLNECVFIGDHHNDVRIVEKAGLGIAFDPKDENLKKVADVIILKKDLRNVLSHII